MKTILHAVPIYLAACLSALPLAYADSITFSTDRTVTGTILQTNGNNLLLMTDYGTLSYSLAIIKEIKFESLETDETVSTNRMLGSKAALVSLGKQPWAKNLKQIPATVIDKGILRSVPYVSFRCGDDYEVNVYGDPAHPAGIEVGVYRKLLEDRSAKNNCINFIGSLLPQAADRETLGSLR